MAKWSFALAAIVAVTHKSNNVSAFTFSPNNLKSCSFSADPTSRCVSPQKMSNSYIDSLSRNEDVNVTDSSAPAAVMGSTVQTSFTGAKEDIEITAKKDKKEEENVRLGVASKEENVIMEVAEVSLDSIEEETEIPAKDVKKEEEKIVLGVASKEENVIMEVAEVSLDSIEEGTEIPAEDFKKDEEKMGLGVGLKEENVIMEVEEVSLDSIEEEIEVPAKEVKKEEENISLGVATKDENVIMEVEEVSLDSIESNVSSNSAPELTVEEKVAAALSSIARNIFGQKSNVEYRNVRETLRDAKTRSQRRISRSQFEKEKAAEKIASLEAILERKKKEINAELDERMKEAQTKIDEEMERVTASLKLEIQMEAERQSEISGLMSTLNSAIESILADIYSDEAITAEMQTVRSKLKPGAIASQLETILERKIKVTDIERQLVDEMTACVVQMEITFQESQNRAKKMENTLSEFVLPDVKKVVPCEWSSIEAMEQVLEEAAEDAFVCQAKIISIRDQINGALVAKNTVLGGDVPASLTKVTQKLVEKKDVAGLTGTEATAAVSIAPVVGLSDLKNSPDEEVLSVLSKSAATAALSGGKTVIYGLKSILDSVTDNQVAAATSSAIEKSSGITKGLTNISSAAQGKKRGGVTNTIDNIKDLAKGEEVKSTLKSTGETLGALGQAGKIMVSGIGDRESSKQSTQAAKEAGQSLWTAINAVAALGSKQVAKLKEQADDSKNK